MWFLLVFKFLFTFDFGDLRLRNWERCCFNGYFFFQKTKDWLWLPLNTCRKIMPIVYQLFGAEKRGRFRRFCWNWWFLQSVLQLLGQISSYRMTAFQLIHVQNIFIQRVKSVWPKWGAHELTWIKSFFLLLNGVDSF